MIRPKGLGRGLDADSTSIETARVELLAGDCEAAERELRRDYEALDGLGERYFRSTVAALLAQALWCQNRLEEAGRFADVAEEISEPDDVLSQVTWRGARAKIMADGGAYDDAERTARAAVEMVSETAELSLQGDALIDLAEVIGRSGRGTEAKAVLEEALALYERKGDLTSAERARRLMLIPR